MGDFERDVVSRVAANGRNVELKASASEFLKQSILPKYSYNFFWMGLPIIQYPQDMVAMQEIIWEIKPDLIVETGIARGGSLVFYASLLELNASCGGPADAVVLGIDIDIRTHNRLAIESHPMSRRISMIQGSSVAPEIVRAVCEKAKSYSRILVCLDSNHTHDHVLQELEVYAPLTSVGSYCVVFDTLVEDLPGSFHEDRPWGTGNNPKTAVDAYLKTHREFEVANNIESKLLITVAPGGYLKRVK